MTCWSQTSSGPAALGTVLGTYGIVVSPSQLETLSSAVGHRGTLSSLGTGAQTANMRVMVLQATPDQLPLVPLPAVAEGADGEFRVFVSTGAQGVEVFDPVSGGRGFVAVPDLASIWTGRLLLIHPLGF
jgi:subfamily B ATP-binding cassette protein HlyB/CyaB